MAPKLGQTHLHTLNWFDKTSFMKNSSSNADCGLNPVIGAIICALTVVLTLVAAPPGNANPSVKPEDIPLRLFERGKSLSAFKAVMSVSTMNEIDKSRQDVKGFMIYRRPSDFRFQGVGPGGNSLFELILKANHFELYVPSDGKILTGAKDCFARRFPDVSEIEGLIPMILLQWRDVRFDRLLSKDPEKIVIRISFQGRVWGATLDPQNLYLLRLVRLNPKGDIDLTADFGDFKSGDDGWLPRKFEIQSISGKWKTIAKISKIEANPFIVEKNFQLDNTFSAKTEQCR